MENIVEIKKISKVYKTGEQEFKALDNIDLQIEKGKFVVVLGPSGAGKSTLLNLIGGMDTPSSGSIKIDGEDISKYNDTKLSEYRAENIGFIFQFYNILPTLTVLENVELIKDVVKEGTDSKEAIKAVGLEKHMNKFPSQLSGGEQQRVSIARAIAKNPKLLLCDEPTGALDYKTGKSILKLLQNMARKENMTVIADEGLVGHVISVTDHTAKVQTIIDTATAVTSTISTTKDTIIVQGTLENSGELKATYIPTDATVLQGDNVETSGLGGIYPKGITIGTIKQVVNTKNITERYAIVEAAVDFSKLATVLVITN